MARSINGVCTVTGLDGILKELDALGKRIKGGGIDKALRAASKPVIEAMRREVPVETGSLRKSLGLKLKRFRKTARVSIIGARVKAYQTALGKRNPAYYAHLVEFGTRPHSLGVKRKFRRQGKGPMHPGSEGTGSMRRGWEAGSTQAKGIIVSTLRQVVESKRPVSTSAGEDEA